MTKIEWCDETINPLQDKRKGKSGRGYHCTKISAGCLNCYSETLNKRFGNGLLFDDKPVQFELIQSELDKPLHWKKPRRIFVVSMGDLFHEKVPFDYIKRVREIAIKCPQHTLQFLTKRVEQMLKFTQWLAGHDDISIAEWPRNCWLGVSISTEAEDWKIAELLKIPAAVRFVSIEPFLEPIVFTRGLWSIPPHAIGKLDWGIVGCESGSKRRPCPDIRGIVGQFYAAQIPLFVKQVSINGKVSKNMAEWPEELRVREMPDGK